MKHSVIAKTITFFCLSIALFSTEIDVSQELRILQLMPRDQVVNPLCIDPAVPKNFVALDLDGKQNIYQWICWGPEETLKAFFKDQKSLNEPILAVMVMPNVAQKEYGKLTVDEIKPLFNGYKRLNFETGHWGDIPYVLVEGDMEDRKVRFAFVGINQDGFVYMFRLIYPDNRKLESSDIALWDTFIKETKELPAPLMFKCLGQEMHIGHTICDAAGRKLLFKAELNETTKKVQVTVEPQEGSINFQFAKAELCKMGADWHQDEPMIKLYGMIEVENGWVNVSQVTSVLLKKTTKFTKPSKKAEYHEVFNYDEEGVLKEAKAS